MSEQTIRETNLGTNIRGFWVGGQRFRRSNGKTGWYIMTWSDTAPVAAYWVAEGRFYKARTRWVESRTFEVEILREAIDVEPQRKTVALEAIGQWESPENEFGAPLEIKNFEMIPG